MSDHNSPHIIYIITQLELGGAQKVCLNLIKGLSDKGIAVTLISGAEGPLVKETTHFKSVYLLNSLKNELSLQKNDFITFFELIKIIKKIKKENPHVIVHTHSTKAGIFGRWAAFFAGAKKRIHTVHGFGFNNYQSKARWLIIYFLELITAIITTKFICVSQKDRDEGAKLFPHFQKKSLIIRAAVDYKTFYKPSFNISYTPKNEIIIGSISCFKPQKNLFDLLKAFESARTLLAVMHGISCRLQIIGDGTQRTQLEEWIIDHHLTQYITLLGWQHDVKPWLQTWDIFTLSSLWEGLPCSVIEARLSKVPVVAYNVGGISEIIIPEKNGLLIEPGNWQNLSTAFITLASDQKLLHTLGIHEDNLVAFSNSFMIAKHYNFYHALFEKPRSNPV